MSRRPGDGAVRARLRALADERRRFGTELTSHAILRRQEEHAVLRHCIGPSKPRQWLRRCGEQNGFAESGL